MCLHWREKEIRKQATTPASSLQLIRVLTRVLTVLKLFGTRFLRPPITARQNPVRTLSPLSISSGCGRTLNLDRRVHGKWVACLSVLHLTPSSLQRVINGCLNGKTDVNLCLGPDSQSPCAGKAMCNCCRRTKPVTQGPQLAFQQHAARLITTEAASSYTQAARQWRTHQYLLPASSDAPWLALAVCDLLVILTAFTNVITP